MARLSSPGLQASMRIRNAGRLPKLETTTRFPPPLTRAPSSDQEEPGSTPPSAVKRAREGKDEYDMRQHIEELTARLEHVERALDALPPVGSCLTVPGRHVGSFADYGGLWVPVAGRLACERWYLADDLNELLPLSEGQPSLRATFEGKELFRLANHAVDDEDMRFIRVTRPPTSTYTLDHRGFFHLSVSS